MGDPVANVFEGLGIEAADAARLASLLPVAPEDTPEGDPPEVGTLEAGTLRAGRLLAAAVAAAGDAALLVSALPCLLVALDAHQGQLDDPEHGVLWHLRGLGAWRIDHDVPAATRALNRAVVRLEENRDERSRAYAGRVYDTFGQMLQHQGLLADARQAFERALQHKQASRDLSGAALTQGNLGRLCMESGDFPAAAEHLARDLDYVSETDPGNARLKSQLLTQIGVCKTATGEWEDARRLLTESLKLAEGIADPIGLAFATVHLGRLALDTGHLDDAHTRAEAARRLLPEIPLFVALELTGLTLQLSAGVARERGHLDEALEYYREAGEHFERAGRISPVEHAESLQTHARACEEAGQPRQAADLLRRALHRLDATTAQTMRAQLDLRLKDVDEATWTLHSIGRFVGHGQIELLLSEGGHAGFRGSEEEVTILFSDLRGFTTFTEKLDPEVLIDVLNRYLACMTRCVEHFGGMVDKFIGDAVMAVFSLPQVHEDDADRATQAALYMQTELERFNRSLPDSLPQLAAGVGLHRGRVVAGLIGSPQRRSYTVIGDAVNTASRLEGMTKQLGVPILVSRDVVDRLEHPERGLLLPLGRFRPKGRRGPIEVFFPMGERDGSADARAAEGLIERAAAALALFEQRDFGAAWDQFKALAAATGPETGARGFALLADAAAAFLTSPPRGDWDGSIELTEK